MNSIEELRAYFERCRAIAIFISETMWQAVEEDGPRREKLLRGLPVLSGPNPCHEQIEANGGIGLEFYYGNPCYALWTPLGTVGLSGPCGGRSDLIDLGTSRVALGLALKEKLAIRRDDMGEFGPVFSIGRDPGGSVLPEIAIRKKSEFVKYEEVKRIWRDIGLEVVRP